jgi:hypothetical protein
MRAYIKRSLEVVEILNKVEIDKDCRYDQEYWLFLSEESFHGTISDTKDSFIFQDQRLPEFELALTDVILE